MCVWGGLSTNSQSSGDEVSCLRTQHHAPDEHRTRDLAIKESDALTTELSMLYLWCRNNVVTQPGPQLELPS